MIQPTHEREPETLVRKADECLYQAKGEGRNRVVAAKA
jgi:PleD family two-component response regulator